MMNDYRVLENKLGYWFQDRSLLNLALTHCSFERPHNERLEFLGDTILNAMISKILYDAFPESAEGPLSYARSSLVSKVALASIAKALKLAHYIKLGPGEIKNGGQEKLSILANTLEAILGAIWLDGGEVACMTVVQCWYQNKLATLDTATMKDPKTKLQEYTQAHNMTLPQYHLKTVQGQAHRQTFVVECMISDISQCTEAASSSRKGAEQLAAGQLLKKLS